jgi:hypothetical protein
MIRNRYPQFQSQKRQNNYRNIHQPSPYTPIQSLPWEYDYYHFKSELSDVANTSMVDNIKTETSSS